MVIISCVQTKHRDAQNVTLLQVFARDVKDFMAFLPGNVCECEDGLFRVKTLFFLILCE